MESNKNIEALKLVLSRQIVRYGLDIKNIWAAELAAKGFDITTEMYSVLIFLWEEEGLTQLELGQRVMKSKANLTKILNNLAKLEYIERKINTGDRRQNLIYLTTKGKSLEDDVLSLAVKKFVDTEQQLDPERLRITKETLERFMKHL